MSKSEFKTERKVETATKFNAERKVSMGSDYSSSSDSITSEDLDKMNTKELKSLKRQLGVKSKAKSKSGLKSAINKHLDKEQKGSTPRNPEEPKSLDKMSNAELRIVARRYGLPHSGKNASNVALKRNIKKHLKENPQANTNDDPRIMTRNEPDGSTTAVHMEEFQPINVGDSNLATYDVTVVDKDIEGHKRIEIDEPEGKEGTFVIKQYSEPDGEEEQLLINMIESTDAGGEALSKSKLKEREKLQASSSVTQDKVDPESEVIPGNGDSKPETKVAYRKSAKNRVEFKKRKVKEKSKVEVPKGRGFKKVPARVVPKGKEPYEWQIAIPDKSKTKDLTDKKRLIITEKSEVANTIKKLNTDYYVHNLGGNPFGSVQRTAASDNPDKIRRSKKTIVFRQDQAFAPFVYPKVSKDAEVIIIADEDYLGQYLSENLAHTLPTSKITIYNVESTSPKLLMEVLDGEHPEYEHDVNKAIGGAWYIESQSEIGGTLTSALTGKNGILDHFTREQRGNKTWSKYKQAYLQGTAGLNLTDQEFAVTGKVLGEELNQDVRIIATIKTDLGLKTVEAIAKPSTTDIDAKFIPIGEPRDLNVKNTDQTTMILMSDLKIESVQAEELIKRLASQGVISYPRTEYEGISPKEDIQSEELAEVWLSYHPEYAKDRDKIVQGINRIQADTPELPRSGILVLQKTKFKENTIERKTVESIAKANIWASLNYYEIDGELQIHDQTGTKLGEKPITVISKDPKFVGQVIDVQTEKREGMSDKEMFEFLSENELGTVATRTNLIKRLEQWGFVLKSPKGEYKLDDRMKVLTIHVGSVDPSFTSGEFSKWLKDKRVVVANNPLNYNQQKGILYNRLAVVVSDLYENRVIQRTEQEFQNISMRTQLDTFIRSDLQDDMVQIE